MRPNPRFGGAEHVCWAHRHGARVVVPASAAAFSPAGQAALSAMLLNVSARAAWIESVVSNIASSGADGCTIDIEGNNEHADKLTLLIGELRSALLAQNPHSQLSFDTQAMPAIANLTCRDTLRRCLARSHGPSLGFDYAALMQHLDFLVPMNYEHNFWSTVAGPNCDMRVMMDGVEQYAKLGVPASKLVSAMPIYGYDYTCTNQSWGAPCALIPAQASSQGC
jgi:spore germination protein YaaH